MRYGVAVPNAGAYSGIRTLVQLAQEAEAAGWDGFFLWDHIVFGPEPVVDPWVALTAIALGTSRLRLGPLVTPLPRRRPWTVARQTVSLDHLSGGRLILGVGIGDGPWEWDDLGEVADMRVRGAMLDEGLAVLAGLWRGTPFRYDGTHYRLQETVFVPPPLQSPRIPVWVAAGWPRMRPLRRAARWDGVVVKRADEAALTPAEVWACSTSIAAQRTSAAPFDVVMAGCTTGQDPAADADLIAPFAAGGLTWWIEQVRWRGSSVPWRDGRGWDGAWPVEAMQARIRRGPPRRS